MAYDDSEGSEDSDMEDLQTPSSPPEKPPNLVMFYIVDNRDRGLTDEELRTEFGERIGQQAKQKWKRKHKKAKKRYKKLLQLYLDANPDFDENQIQQRGSPRKKTKSTRKRNRNTYTPRQRYVGINTYDDDVNEYQPQSKKKRKTNDNVNNNSSIDELFREINSGSKRVVRDPDKFKPTQENKIQMQNLVEKMREAARQDWECNTKSEPAINTSLMLDVVVSELSKKLFYKYYLDDTDLLEALRDWIHPLPDGSLPALKIRTECYRIIAKLQLHDILEKQSLDHYLQVSEDKSRDQNYASDIHPNLKSFSKTCMNLWANAKETNANKQLLRKIMEKWIRTLTGSDSSYNVLIEEMRENQDAIQERYKILQKQKRDFNFGEQKRAKIPEKPWHDFATNPANIVDEDLNISRIGGNPHPMQEKMIKQLRKNTSSKQAARPSVTGRKHRK